MRVVGCTLAFVFGLISTISFGQRGHIIAPATTAVMDPNQDGYVSMTTAGFSNDGFYVDEFEIPMFGIPIVGDGEVLNDNQVGPNCGTTDLTVDTRGFAVYGVLDGAGNLIFRFRVANDKPSVEAYTILIDTDGRFGSDDPNATANNPGFEIDITLIKNNSKGVYVYNIDGIESCPSPTLQYGFSSHFQIAIADIISCGDPDYFYDYYVPFSDLESAFGLSPITELRFVAVTNISATCAMAGKISDVGGVDDTQYAGCNTCAFLDLTSNQCPTAISNLCTTCAGFLTGVTPKPGINVPLKAGEFTITGTAVLNAEVYVDVFDSNDQLKDRDTTNVDPNGHWISTIGIPLAIGDSVTARAKGFDQCQSGSISSGASFTIVVQNQPPVLTVSATSLLYTENDPALAILGSLGISDADDSVLVSAAVTITGNFSGGEDILSFTATPGVSGSYDPSTGSILFSGTASLATYQSLLRTLKYTNSSEDPSALTRSIEVTVNDALDVSNSITIDIDVVTVNDPPVVTGSATGPTYAGAPLVIDNTVAVADVDNPTLAGATVSITNNLAGAEDQLNFTDQNGITGTYDAGTGVLTLSGNASLAAYTTALQGITYSNSNLIPSKLTRRVTFVANDGSANSQPFNILIDFPGNSPPEIVDDSNNPLDTVRFTIDEDIPLDTCILAIDPDGDDVAIGVVTASTGNGTFTLNGGLCFTFVPNPNFFGEERAQVTVCDSATPSLCDTATVVITILPVNDPAVVDTIMVTVKEDSSALICVQITDVENDPQQVSAGSSVAGSGVLSDPDPTDLCFTYAPNPGFVGSDTVVVEVCDSNDPGVCTTGVVFVEVVPEPNEPPQIYVNGAPGDTLNASTPEDTPLLLCFDAVDPDGDSITVSSVLNTLGGGTLVAYDSAGFCFQFDPVANYYGSSEWEVEVCDDGSPILCGTAVLIIDVISVNDPPVISGSFTPVVYSGSALIVDSTLTVDDIDDAIIETASISITNNFQAGEDALNFVNQNGISGVYNAATGALMLSGPASLADYSTALTSITYSNSNILPATLTRRVSFVVNDGDDDSAPVNILIDFAGNNPPEIVDGSGNSLDTLHFTIDEDSRLDTCIVAIDPDGDDVVISSISMQTGNGLFALQGGLCFSFIPDPDFFGEERASITVCDSGVPSLCDTALVVIAILPVNDPAVVDTLIVTVQEDSNTEICAVISDKENDPQSVSGGSSSASNGTITDPDPTDLCFNYLPDPGFVGSDTVTVVVCDSNDPTVCSTGVIYIDVTPLPNNPPDILILGIPGDTLKTTTEEDTPVVFCFEAVDPDGDDVFFSSAVNTEGGGTLETYQHIEFCFEYTPPLNFYGRVIWEIEVCDDGVPSLCGTAIAIIDVTPVNDAPAAVPDTLIVKRRTSVNGNVLTNDFDVEGDALTVSPSPVVNAQHGDFFLYSDGSFTYQSEKTFQGTETVVYSVCDDGAPSLCSEGQLTIIVELGPLTVYQGVTPNGDNANDYLIIEEIDYYTDNHIRIFDRFNNLVYEARGYDNENVVWGGQANRGLARGALPDGTYFYVLDLGDGSKPQGGFVVLKQK